MGKPVGKRITKVGLQQQRTNTIHRCFGNWQQILAALGTTGIAEIWRSIARNGLRRNKADWMRKPRNRGS